eukprot:c9154_g1_i1 orf=40-354(-)
MCCRSTILHKPVVSCLNWVMATAEINLPVHLFSAMKTETVYCYTDFFSMVLLPIAPFCNYYSCNIHMETNIGVVICSAAMHGHTLHGHFLINITDLESAFFRLQ